ncbi:MAG TPA: sigma-70 family RNA polymerase sigma factor [Cyclobacteriaceae bacterium]|nr:sigma-70 family RNA polymerase sigma factor [Cyclobacteriaceae bacterium]
MKFDQLEDHVLWELISKGNSKAFAHIYNAFSSDLFKYGHKFTRDSELISDVIQDVYVHLWESRKTLSIQKSIKFYLLSSFRRKLVRKIKTDKNQEALEDFHYNVSWQESFEEVLLENQISLESSIKVTKALENLSVRQKEAIFLRYIQELSYEEISALMNIQVPSLYNLIFKGIKSMREFLSSSNFTARAIGFISLFLAC